MVSCLMGDSTALASAIVRCCLKEIENILQTVKSDKDFQSMGKKEQASVIAKLLQDIAAPKGIELKLRKK